MLMKSFLQTRLVLALLLLAILLATCTGLPDTQTAAVATLPPTRAAPGNTASPMVPTRTAQPSTTAAPVYTATPQPSPTLPDDISQVTLVAHGVLPNWNYLFTFGFAAEVQGSYRLVVDQNKEYTCTSRSDQPLFLYCDGPMAAFDDFVDYELRTADDSMMVLRGEVYIPYEFTP